MRYKVLNHSTAYSGFFKLDKVKVQYESFKGHELKPQVREIFERGEAAAIIPYDPIRDEIVWVEQFRVGALQAGFSPWIIETVAGVVEENEPIVELVYREAKEEAGLKISALEKIASFLVSPGGTSEVVHLYCGKTNTNNVVEFHGLEHEGEDIKAHVLSYNDSVKWYREGEFNSATPLIAMQWLMLNRDRLRAIWL